MLNHIRALLRSSPSVSRLRVPMQFTATGIWYRKPGLVELEVIVIGAGGAAAYTTSVSPYTIGEGATGGSGGLAWTVIAANYLRRQEVVTVGLANGGTSSFGDHVSATGGADASGTTPGGGGGGVIARSVSSGIAVTGDSGLTGTNVGSSDLSIPSGMGWFGAYGRGGRASRPGPEGGINGIVLLFEHYGAP